MHCKTIQEIKDILIGKVFTVQFKRSYIFDGDNYTILQGDFSLLIRRNTISLKDIKTKYKYSIFQYESNFVFRTYENEIYPDENEFIISINENKIGTYTVMFLSLGDKTERLRLISD